MEQLTEQENEEVVDLVKSYINEKDREPVLQSIPQRKLLKFFQILEVALQGRLEERLS